MPLPASLQKALAKKSISDGPSGTTTIAIGQAKNTAGANDGTKMAFDRTPAQAALYNGSPLNAPKGKK